MAHTLGVWQGDKDGRKYLQVSLSLRRRPITVLPHQRASHRSLVSAPAVEQHTEAAHSSQNRLLPLGCVECAHPWLRPGLLGVS